MKLLVLSRRIGHNNHRAPHVERGALYNVSMDKKSVLAILCLLVIVGAARALKWCINNYLNRRSSCQEKKTKGDCKCGGGYGYDTCMDIWLHRNADCI